MESPRQTNPSRGKEGWPDEPGLGNIKGVNYSVDLTILMPCLNEAETIARCIAKAKVGLQRAGVTGEILIADNGSTDGSQEIATQLGARVVPIAAKGYGNALRGGIEAAYGRWILMGDADDSYDFSEADRFVKKLQAGDDVVMGCRLPSGGGVIQPGAMPWKNRWIGNPVLTSIGRLFFTCPARDFHCGLRAFTKQAFFEMDVQTTGMEFASEMIIKSTLRGHKISEVPVTLYKDGRSRPPHLKPWRDGWRHLRFMLLFSPRWLFLVPGLVLFFLSLIVGLVLSVSDVRVGDVTFNVGTLTLASLGMVVGFQAVAFAVFTKVFGIGEGLLPQDPKLTRVFKILNLETGILVSLLVLLTGVGLLADSVWQWHAVHYGQLPSMEENLRRLIPAATLLILGIQGVFSSFFLSVLGLRTVIRKPPASAH